MKCLECGHDLIEMRRELVEYVIENPITIKADCPWSIWKSSHTLYAGHCKNCLRDWEWDECFKDGKVTVSQPTRIFWG